ncbi:DUF7344 domain-containing protein [Halostella salina]|uniref:DUF7344 domain-containing protein n=1 Tax=Halostella salina TaxID=1547897 RepID=UPI000EF75CD6|nr:hypothetical protein [Halostella salina]
MSQSTHAADDSGTTLSNSERHRLLASAQRRAVVGVLADRSVPIELNELAAAVAAEPTDDTTDGRTARETATALHHHHLPMMADLGAIEYDAETNAVAACHVCPAALRE